MRNFPTLAAAALLLLTGCHHVEPYGPVPTRQQLAWQDMEMYAFIHYSMNTYTDQEWGFGDDSRPSTTAGSACGRRPIRNTA